MSIMYMPMPMQMPMQAQNTYAPAQPWMGMQQPILVVQAPMQAQPAAPVVQAQTQGKQVAQAHKKRHEKKKKQQVSTMANEKPCEHNSWDNVRVVRKKMTLRCRVCQKQWRAQVETIWKKWKCENFSQDGTCANGDACTKLHLHYRKQGLEERLSAHGSSVLDNLSPQPPSRSASTACSSLDDEHAQTSFLSTPTNGTVLSARSHDGHDDDDDDDDDQIFVTPPACLIDVDSEDDDDDEGCAPRDDLTPVQLTTLLSSLNSF